MSHWLKLIKYLLIKLTILFYDTLVDFSNQICQTYIYLEHKQIFDWPNLARIISLNMSNVYDVCNNSLLLEAMN